MEIKGDFMYVHLGVLQYTDIVNNHDIKKHNYRSRISEF